MPLGQQQINPHSIGTSAVCVTMTNIIVFHTLNLIETVYDKIFSCKMFDRDIATKKEEIGLVDQPINRELSSACNY